MSVVTISPLDDLGAGRHLRMYNSDDVHRILDQTIQESDPMLVGLAWSLINGPKGKPSGSAILRSQAQTGEEVPPSMRNPSYANYDNKRVENSRWNNLRGMWGKRSVPIDIPLDDNETNGSLNH